MKFAGPSIISKTVAGLNSFMENRAQNEKNMIVIFVFVLILFVDYYVWIHPVIQVFTVTTSKLLVDKQKLEAMEEDLKNKEKIHQRWHDAGNKASEMDKQFILRTEVPSILESLSKLAQECQVKIITLKPADMTPVGPGFLCIPIRLSAVAGTHDLGKFLSRLETGPIYFKVTDLRITSNAADEYRHTVELSIETFAKSK